MSSCCGRSFSQLTQANVLCSRAADPLSPSSLLRTLSDSIMGCGSSSAMDPVQPRPANANARPSEERKEGETEAEAAGGGVHLIDYDDGSNAAPGSAADGPAVPLGRFDLPEDASDHPDPAAAAAVHERKRPNFTQDTGDCEIEGMRGYFNDLAPSEAYAGSYSGGFFLVRNAIDLFGPKRAQKALGMRFPHGRGKIVYTAPPALVGFTYEGAWVDGLREGAGKFSDVLGSQVMAGNWVRDVLQEPYRTWKWRDGAGLVEVTGEAERIAAAHAERLAHLSTEIRSIEYPDDSSYEGDCLERGHALDANDRPIPHGRGVMTFWAGDARLHYRGAWEHGLQSGVGSLTYKDGRRFLGHWSKGKEHGEGTMFDAKGHVMQHGKWVEGVLQSQMQLLASAPDEPAPATASAAASSSSTAVPGLLLPRQPQNDESSGSNATPRLDAKALSPRDIESMIAEIDVDAPPADRGVRNAHADRSCEGQ